MQKINLFGKTKQLITSCRNKMTSVMLVGLTSLYTSAVLAEGDELSGMMSNLKNTFGAGSTFIHILYGLEVIVGAYTYHKTKNIGALAGIAIIALFLNFSLDHWVFTA